MSDMSRILSFSCSNDFAKWLEANHATEKELWVKIFKKNTNIPSVTWDDVVIESLCWGWIDGIKKSVDEKAYLQRITPRKAGSNWSKRNTEHVARLIEQSKMQEPGLIHVNAAKADGRWDQAYKTSEMEVPEDFIEALNALPKAQFFYDSLTKSSRFIIAYGLLSAKKPETRQRRFEKYMDQLLQNKKPR